MSTQNVKLENLESVVKYLNKITNSPAEPWYRDDQGKLHANIGNYHLSGAYGGYELHRMCTDGGGINTPLNTGHTSKKELYHAIHQFIYGIEEGLRLAEQKAEQQKEQQQ
jgi:hypothetical protein